MPRTSAVEVTGFPLLWALTTDVLGLVKALEAKGKAGAAKVVETWGPPDASRGILAASFAEHETSPLIAVAQKSNLVFLKQHLTTVVIDPHFSSEECAGNSADQPSDLQAVEQTEANGDDADDDELLLSPRSKKPEEEKNKTESKTSKRNKGVPEDDKLMEEGHSLSLSEDETDRLPASKQREPSSERKMRSKKSKQNKSKGVHQVRIE